MLCLHPVVEVSNLTGTRARLVTGVALTALGIGVSVCERFQPNKQGLVPGFVFGTLHVL